MELPVGVIEIAKMLGVQDRTVHQWLRRRLLPEADFGVVNGSRVWKRATILKWAGETGRLRSDDLQAEYRRRFRKNPQPVRNGGRLPVPPPPRVPAAKKKRTEKKRKATARG